MKKLLFTLAAVALTVFCTDAQIAIEKTPPSFNKDMNSPLVTKKLPAFDVQAMLAEDEITKGEGPFRFGKRHPVEVALTNDGTWEELPNGDRIWRMTFYSPKAYSLNFLFSRFYMPQGAELYAYNADKSDTRGAFTAFNNKADGMFAITPIEGDKVTLEYYEPAAVNGLGILELSYVVHAYRNLHDTAEEILEKNFGDSGACNNDVACPVSAGWEDQIRSVGIIIISGFRACTGAMVNNTAQDGTPYFLSANHCGTGINSNWSFVFNYDSPSCSGPDGSLAESVAGGVLRASSAASDFALFELSAPPPASYQVYYAGWNNQDVAASSTTAIHHPSGDVKKISFNNDPAYEGAWGSGSTPVTGGNHWVVGQWEDGTTEPGSSGSPLFDENKLIIGQLHGGSASCGSVTYDSYGKLFTSWQGEGSPASSLETWLGSGSTLEGQYFGVPSTCFDGMQNSDEVGIDCGGSCLNVCPSCSDGVQNGNETNVDCGGPDCAVCPPCSGVTFSITLDDYPEETSWVIVDANGNQVAFGGGYSTDGATVVESACLFTGCYDFVINDSFGDGICCGFGIGSYTLTDDATGNVVASGGEFDDSETTNFCVTAGPACAGVDLDITFDGTPQQTSWDITDASGTVVATSGGNVYGLSLANSNLGLPNISCLPDGCYDLNFYDSVNNGMCPFRATATSSGVFVTPGTVITPGTLVATLGTVVAPGLCGDYTLRDANGTILVSGGAGFGGQESQNFCLSGGIAQLWQPDNGEAQDKQEPFTELKVFPTLANTDLFVYTSELAEGQINIIDINGQIIHQYEQNVPQMQLNVSNLSAGVYFVQVLSGNTVLVEKFVKK